jgi:hypothetical protein
MEHNLVLAVFPEGSVGHGHPACLAYLITLAFPDFDTATERPAGATYCNALCDQRIPGSGDAVWAAIDVLKRAQHFGAEQAFEHAQAQWDRLTGSTSAIREAGREQASRLRIRFIEAVAQWTSPVSAEG